MTRVLITGAAGSVGTMLRTRLARPDRELVLLDRVPVPGAASIVADITDPAALAEACADVDAIVHLAGIAHEDTWPNILSANIDGTHNVLAAAQAAGVPRVLLASSNHATGFTRRGDRPLPADADIRPDTFYGVSKVAMEGLGKLYADRYGMDVVSLRIGSCFAAVTDVRHLATWLSPDDCGRMVEACLTTPAPGYKVVWGVSRNTRRWWSLAEGEALGYDPRDDAERYAAEVGEGDWTGDPNLYLVGGPYCSTPLGGSN